MTKRKIITSEQMVYIINMVAIPRIEYKAQLTILNEAEANRTTSKLRRLLRNKIGIANTAPNVMLNRKETYNLIDFFDRQVEAQVANLVLKLNNQTTLGYTTEIRLRQLQSQEWLHDNPTEIWNYNNMNTFKTSIIAQILCLMNHWGIL